MPYKLFYNLLIPILLSFLANKQTAFVVGSIFNSVVKQPVLFVAGVIPPANKIAFPVAAPVLIVVEHVLNSAGPTLFFPLCSSATL